MGGGDSTLVDYLLDAGYTNITVLDISEKALEKTKLRLKNRAHLVTWIISDILDFMPSTKYDVWHDRATFHFLTTSEQINSYRLLINSSINEFIIIGTFSLTGPKNVAV